MSPSLPKAILDSPSPPKKLLLEGSTVFLCCFAENPPQMTQSLYCKRLG